MLKQMQIICNTNTLIIVFDLKQIIRDFGGI